MRSGFKAGAKISRMRAPSASELIERYEDEAMDVAAQHFRSQIRQDDVKSATQWLSVMQDIHQLANPRPRKLHS